MRHVIRVLAVMFATWLPGSRSRRGHRLAAILSALVLGPSLAATHASAIPVTRRPSGGFTATGFSRQQPANGFTEVRSACPSDNKQWEVKQPEGVGFQDFMTDCGPGAIAPQSSTLYRALYRINTKNLSKAMHVQQAILQTTVVFSADQGCNDSWPLTVHWMNPVNSKTDWDSATVNAADKPRTVLVKSAHNPQSNCPQTQQANFDVTYAIKRMAAGGQKTWSLGLFGDEARKPSPPPNTGCGSYSKKNSYNCGFMRIGDKPDIITTFDLTPPVPAVADTATSQPPIRFPGGPRDYGCGTKGRYGWVDDPNISLDVTVHSSIKNERARAVYRIQDDNGRQRAAAGPSDYLAPGDLAVAPLTEPLRDGHSYTWRAANNVDGNEPGSGDPSGTDGTNKVGYTSAWSAPCHFNVDFTAPVRPSVNSRAFPPSGGGNKSGSTGTFNFSSADPVPSGCRGKCLVSGVARFGYSLNGSPVTWVHARPGRGSTSASAKVAVRVGNWGTNVLQVQAQDNAGNVSAPDLYSFFVPFNKAAKVVAGDINGDGIPDLLAATGHSLDLYPGDRNVAAKLIVASNHENSPSGGPWDDFQVSHRGALHPGGVDDLYVHDGPNMLIYINNPSSPGTAPQFGDVGSARLLARPSCSRHFPNGAFRQENCVGYATGSWSAVTQILATQDVWARSRMDTRWPSLLTVERGSLWLFEGDNSNVQFPVLLGSSAGAVNWSDMTLIAPGFVNGVPTFWARDKRTGVLYSYRITIGSDHLPTLHPAQPAVPVTATSGTVIRGIRLPAAVYPAVASSGILGSSKYPGLFAEKVTGRSPNRLSCATGCLYFYPGRTVRGGAPPLTSRPMFVGLLHARAAQLS